MDEVEDLALYHMKRDSEAFVLPNHGSRRFYVYIVSMYVSYKQDQQQTLVRIQSLIRYLYL
jgi:hypothetical protein